MSNFKCTQCELWKKVVDFVKKQSVQRGHTPICKKCMATNNRVSYRKIVRQEDYIIQQDPFREYNLRMT